MKTFTTAFAAASLLGAVAGSSVAPTAASAQPVEHSYVACNQYGECWRVHDVYAYGPSAPITYYNSDWYETHRTDEHVRWLADPANDRGYYDREGHWRSDPAARAVKGGLTGAGLGAAIGCLVTLPVGCAPGAATGAAVGGGAGAAVGAGTTPPR
jgi:hypothetical protein